jgi:exonuclease SbcD
LSGKSQLHGQLIASTDQLMAECRAAALALGDEAAWIERVVVATEPHSDPAAFALRKDTFGDLQSLIEQARTDDALFKQLALEFGEFVRKLPHEVRTEFDDPFVKAAMEGDYASVVAQAGTYLTARLAAEGL